MNKCEKWFCYLKKTLLFGHEVDLNLHDLVADMPQLEVSRVPGERQSRPVLGRVQVSARRLCAHAAQPTHAVPVVRRLPHAPTRQTQSTHATRLHLLRAKVRLKGGSGGGIGNGVIGRRDSISATHSKWTQNHRLHPPPPQTSSSPPPPPIAYREINFPSWIPRSYGRAGSVSMLWQLITRPIRRTVS